MNKPKFYNNGEVHPETKSNLLYLDIFGRPKPTDKEVNSLMDTVLSCFNHSVNR